MPNSQHGEASDRVAGDPTSAPGSHADAIQPGQPTLHEFLTRLVTSPDARSDFDSDPRAALDNAGFEDMTATDVQHATSLALDYAPVEVVTEYDRSLQSSVENFAASAQHVVVNPEPPTHAVAAEPPVHAEPMHPAHPQEVTDLKMQHDSKPDFSNGGDVDKHIQPQHSENHTDVNVNQQDSHNLLNVHDVASGTEIGDTVGGVTDASSSLVGDVTHTVDNTVDTSTSLAAGGPDVVGDIAGNLPVAGDLVEGVAGGGADAAHGADEGALSGLPVAGPVLGEVTDVAGNLPVAGDVTSALPLDHVL